MIAAAIFKIANGVASSAASLVPASVPRPVAKLGVVGVGSLVALWLFGKVRPHTSMHAPNSVMKCKHGLNACSYTSLCSTGLHGVALISCMLTVPV